MRLKVLPLLSMLLVFGLVLSGLQLIPPAAASNSNTNCVDFLLYNPGSIDSALPSSWPLNQAIQLSATITFNNTPNGQCQLGTTGAQQLTMVQLNCISACGSNPQFPLGTCSGCMSNYQAANYANGQLTYNWPAVSGGGVTGTSAYSKGAVFSVTWAVYSFSVSQTVYYYDCGRDLNILTGPPCESQSVYGGLGQPPTSNTNCVGFILNNPSSTDSSNPTAWTLNQAVQLSAGIVLNNTPNGQCYVGQTGVSQPTQVQLKCISGCGSNPQFPLGTCSGCMSNYQAANYANGQLTYNWPAVSGGGVTGTSAYSNALFGVTWIVWSVSTTNHSVYYYDCGIDLNNGSGPPCQSSGTYATLGQLPLTDSFAYAGANPSTPITPLEQVTFTASCTNGSPPCTYSWNFGDGTTSTGTASTHAYSSPGTYTVQVTATDTAANTASTAQTITVSRPSLPRVSAGFSTYSTSLLGRPLCVRNKLPSCPNEYWYAGFMDQPFQTPSAVSIAVSLPQTGGPSSFIPSGKYVAIGMAVDGLSKDSPLTPPCLASCDYAFFDMLYLTNTGQPVIIGEVWLFHDAPLLCIDVQTIGPTISVGCNLDPIMLYGAEFSCSCLTAANYQSLIGLGMQWYTGPRTYMDFQATIGGSTYVTGTYVPADHGDPTQEPYFHVGTSPQSGLFSCNCLIKWWQFGVMTNNLFSPGTTNWNAYLGALTFGTTSTSSTVQKATYITDTYMDGYNYVGTPSGTEQGDSCKSGGTFPGTSDSLISGQFVVHNPSSAQNNKGYSLWDTTCNQEDQPPSTSFTNPAAGSWHALDFQVSLSDTLGGSYPGGPIALCFYDVQDSQDGTTYNLSHQPSIRPCSSNIWISVAYDCPYQGANFCKVDAWSESYLEKQSSYASQNFSIETMSPSAPAPIQPGNGVYVPSNPTLKWSTPTSSPSGISSYTVLVSQDPSFTTGVSTYTVAAGTNSLSISLMAGSSSWYWKVQAIDNAGLSGPWSATWSFTLDTTPPSTPVLQSPSNGAVLTSTYQTLSWGSATDDTGISTYHVQIDTSSSFNSPSLIDIAGLRGTSYGATLPPESYYWRVQATDYAGNVGAWSSPFSLNIADFSLSVSPDPLNVTAGSHGTWTIAVSSLYEFTGMITFTDTFNAQLSCSAITPTSLTLSTSAPTATSTLTCSGPATTYLVTVNATGGGLTHSKTVVLNSQDFAFSASPASAIGLAGTALSSTMVVLPSYGFMGTVSLSSSVSPTSGLSCSLSPSTISGSGNSTLTCQGSAGNYVVTITGTSGNLSHSTTVKVTVQDFSASVNPGSLTTVAGEAKAATISLSSLNGFSGTLRLSAAVSPSTAVWSCAFTPTSVTLGTTATSNVSCSFRDAGQYTVTVTSSIGAFGHSVSVTYTVTDFSLSVSPTSISLRAGQQGTVSLTVNSLNGYTGSATVSVWFGLPACATASFSPGVVQPPAGGTASSTISLSIGSSCQGSSNYVYVQGIDSGGEWHYTYFLLTTSEFQITLSIPTIGIDPGYPGTLTFTVTNVNSYPSSSLTFSTTGLPSLAVALFSPSPLSMGTNPTTYTETVSIGVSKHATPSTFIVTIAATDGSITRTGTFTLMIGYGAFAVTASPSTLNIWPGASGTETVTISPFYGPYNPLSLSASGLPSCITSYSFNPTTISPPNGGPSALSISTSSSCTYGSTYTVTVTATDGTISQSATFTLSLTCNPCGGGGGSVAAGTLITLADGSQVPVQSLKVGMQLLSYNMTTRQYVTITITRFVSVQTDNQMIIHTTTGRPLIVDQNPAQKLEVMFPNGTWTELSVTELKIGDYLFDASTQTWVQVTGIQYVNGGVHTMYDIYTSAPTLNYIANNYLDYVKV